MCFNFIEKLVRKDKELMRITKIAEALQFDLKSIFNKDKVHELKCYFNDIGRNIDLVCAETETQVSTMQRLMNIITTGIPEADSKTEELKLRIRKRRRNNLKEIMTAMLPAPDQKDIIIYGKSSRKSVRS